MKIHLCFAAAVCFMAYHYRVSAVEFTFLVIAAAFVFVAELFNTAMERMVDFVSPDFHEQAKLIKDLSAGAVLVSAIVSAVIGIIVFFDKMGG